MVETRLLPLTHTTLTELAKHQLSHLETLNLYTICITAQVCLYLLFRLSVLKNLLMFFTIASKLRETINSFIKNKNNILMPPSSKEYDNDANICNKNNTKLSR